MSFWTGRPSKYVQLPKLTPEQMRIQQQLEQSAQGPGAGGAFGGAADYYYNLMSDQSKDAAAFEKPMMRQYNEQIIPDLAEQFAGMGSGGLSSSGFRNAAVSAGADLSERLGAMRANLRQQGAQGLMDVGKTATTPNTENILEGAEQGAAGDLMSAGINAAANYYSGGAAGDVAPNYNESSSGPSSKGIGQDGGITNVSSPNAKMPQTPGTTNLNIAANSRGILPGQPGSMGTGRMTSKFGKSNPYGTMAS